MIRQRSIVSCRALATTPLIDIRVDDALGATTLERLTDAPAFNRWMYSRFDSWLGNSVLEVGSGIGNLSQFFVERERVVLTDIDDAYLELLRDKFGELGGVRFEKMILPEVPSTLTGDRFQSILCVNVLEHIEDDRAALSSMRSLLEKDGRLVLLVPAFQWLFGTLDAALSHFRRYTKRSLRTVLAETGFRVVHLEYFNMGSMLGWWFTGRVLKKKVIPVKVLKLYDSLVPVFRQERLIPWRVGQSVIAVGEKQ